MVTNMKYNSITKYVVLTTLLFGCTGESERDHSASAPSATGARGRALGAQWSSKQASLVIPSLQALESEGVSAGRVSRYLDQGFTPIEVFLLHPRVSPETAEKYVRARSGDTNGVAIAELSKLGVTPADVGSFPRIFSYQETLTLIKGDVPANLAADYVELNRRYGVSIDADGIVALARSGVSFEEIATVAKWESLKHLLWEAGVRKRKQ